MNIFRKWAVILAIYWNNYVPGKAKHSFSHGSLQRCASPSYFCGVWVKTKLIVSHCLRWRYSCKKIRSMETSFNKIWKLPRQCHTRIILHCVAGPIDSRHLVLNRTPRSSDLFFRGHAYTAIGANLKFTATMILLVQSLSVILDFPWY